MEAATILRFFGIQLLFVFIILGAIRLIIDNFKKWKYESIIKGVCPSCSHRLELNRSIGDRGYGDICISSYKCLHCEYKEEFY
jgi:hypothetical protein